MTQQLNIRSDKAYAAAKRLAHRLGVSTTKVVEDALADMEKRTIAPSAKVNPRQAQEFADSLLALAREANASEPLQLGDKSLYNDRGLPK